MSNTLAASPTVLPPALCPCAAHPECWPLLCSLSFASSHLCRLKERLLHQQPKHSFFREALLGSLIHTPSVRPVPPRLMASPGWASGAGWPGLVIWARLTCPPPVCKFVLNSAPQSEWLLPNLVTARSLTHVQGRQSSSCHGPRHPLPPLGQRFRSFDKCGLELLGLRRSSPWRCTHKHKECWSSIGSDVQKPGASLHTCLSHSSKRGRCEHLHSGTRPRPMLTGRPHLGWHAKYDPFCKINTHLTCTHILTIPTHLHACWRRFWREIY